MTRAPSEIEIDIEVEPPKLEEELASAMKAAGWKPAPTDLFASPAVRLEQPFAELPKLHDHDRPSTIPPRSSMSMRVVSIPPQPVPSLPVPSPVDLDAEYEILVGKKGSMIREIGTRARPEIDDVIGAPHRFFIVFDHDQ